MFLKIFFKENSPLVRCLDAGNGVFFSDGNEMIDLPWSSWLMK